MTTVKGSFNPQGVMTHGLRTAALEQIPLFKPHSHDPAKAHYATPSPPHRLLIQRLNSFHALLVTVLASCSLKPSLLPTAQTVPSAWDILRTASACVLLCSLCEVLSPAASCCPSPSSDSIYFCYDYFRKGFPM